MTQLLDPELFLPEPEPATVKYTVISVDDHLVEPRDMFEGRLPAKLQDRAPKVVSEEHHGPPSARRYEYDPTYMLRGLRELHLEFDRA